MARATFRATSVDRGHESAAGRTAFAQAVTQCLPALVFVAAWVSAGTLLVGLLVLLGRGILTR